MREETDIKKGRMDMDRTKPKTRKCMEINVEGICIVCIFDLRTGRNPYKLYLKWYDGKTHRKKVAEYENFMSVLDHLRNYGFKTHWGFMDCWGYDDGV